MSEDNIFTYRLSGRIDSSNAAEVEQDIEKTMDGNPGCEIRFDASDLKYISSAGLRILLKIRKKQGRLSIFNLSNEVYDILEMTGFTEMLDVERAYRHISLENCSEIGHGSNGAVYRLDPETVVKVYYDPDVLPEIKRERELARYAFVKGIPTAISFEIAIVDKMYGSVFELLDADSMSRLIIKNPADLDTYVRTAVDLLKKIHCTEAEPSKLPDVKTRVLQWVCDIQERIDEKTYAKLRAMVEEIPDVRFFIHGDYHTNNIMVQKGDPVLIDMDTVSYGHPVFEFGSSFLAYKGFSTVDRSAVKNFLGLDYDVAVKFWNGFLRLYFEGLTEQEVAVIEKKAMTIGYLRLLRRTYRRDADNTALIEACRENLVNLVSELDNLYF